MRYIVKKSDMIDYFTAWSLVAVGVAKMDIVQIAIKDWSSRHDNTDIRDVIKEATNNQVLSIKRGMYCTASAYAVYVGLMCKYID